MHLTSTVVGWEGLWLLVLRRDQRRWLMQLRRCDRLSCLLVQIIFVHSLVLADIFGPPPVGFRGRCCSSFCSSVTGSCCNYPTPLLFSVRWCAASVIYIGKPTCGVMKHIGSGNTCCQTLGMIIYVENWQYFNLTCTDPTHRKQACHRHQRPEHKKQRQITKWFFYFGWGD
jgi:hypothetical protein